MSDLLFDLQPSYAELSDDGVYRWTLGRRWGTGPVVTFVMLNPSTANAHEDDPTIRKCRGFAERWWNAGGLHVVNLYAFRATKPAAMWAAQKAGADIVGPENDGTWLRGAFLTSYGEGSPVVAAWGANAKVDRVAEVVRIAHEAGVQFQALSVTNGGMPGHPLMLPYSSQPRPWRPVR